MANPNYWYPRHYKGYGEKTAHLSIIEHGAYTLLLDHYYQTRGNLMANASALLRVCRCQSEEERNAVLSVLDQFFTVDERGCYRNKRADKELGIAANVSQARSEAGKAGAKRRWEHGKEMASAMANDVANLQQPIWQNDAQPQPQQHINTPIPPKGSEIKKKKSSISLKTYIEECRTASAKPIPESDTVFEYARQAGIPEDFLWLQWREFQDRYREPGAKLYKDWPAVFRKSVRGNWYRLWYVDQGNQYALTTQGIQAKNTHGERAA
jgi:uncharacterized protein YdaU (DUF1376 family)